MGLKRKFDASRQGRYGGRGQKGWLTDAMPMTARALLLVAALSAASAFGQSRGTDPELANGIRLVDEGNPEGGIAVLDRVVARFKKAGNEPAQLSKAYLYLAIAHLLLSEEQAARARFVEAIRTDDSLKLSPNEFPPKIVQAFEEARRAVRGTADVIPPPGPGKPPAGRRLPAPVFLETVKTGDFANVRQLLTEDPTLVSARDEAFGATALHWAALRGHAAVAALLVAEGADPAAKNSAGETPRDVAARAGRKDIVAILSPGGAAPAPQRTLIEAVKAGDLPRVEQLIDAEPEIVNMRDTAFSATPLHWAALRGHLEVARYLLAKKADPGATNNDGETALAVARRAKRQPMIALLEAASSSPEALLFEAVRSGDDRQVQKLLAEDAQLARARDSSYGATALHWAALKGRVDIARMLLDAGADPAAKNKAGETAEDVATRRQVEMTADVMGHSLVYWVQGLYYRGLLAQGSRVFAMTSAGSTRVWPTYGAVSAAKAALESNIRVLAAELGTDLGLLDDVINAGIRP